MEGIFSMDIKIFGLLKPKYFCFCRKYRLKNLHQLRGCFKTLKRLQHATFNNSSEDIFKTFAELNIETEDDLVLYLMKSNSESAFNIILAFDDATLKNIILISTKLQHSCSYYQG